MKKTLITLAAAAVGAIALPGVAQAELSANLALTSKYKFRGQDQSDSSKSVLPAIQGGLDWEGAGFYVGNWNSSIGFGGGTEMDFYGGWRGEAAGLSLDAGALQYHYPGDTSLNTTEVYASVGWGPLTAKYSHTVSSKWFGVADGRGSGYLEVNGSMELAGGVTLSAHVGSTRFASKARRAGNVADYTDLKLGASVELGHGFTAEAAWVAADQKRFWGDVNDGRVVLTLSKSL